MKQSVLLLSLACLFISACKSSKSTSKASPNEPGPSQLAAVQTTLPAATMDELKQGHALYYGACTKCHAPKNVAGMEEGRLEKTISNMAGKAQLNDAEKDAVWKYALGLNRTSK